MDYKNYDLIDFVLDDFFQAWVFTPTPDAARFWQDWIRQHPEKESIIQKARAVMLSLDFEGINPGEFNQEKVWHSIRATIKTDELTNELSISRSDETELEDDEVGETIMYSLPSRRLHRKKWYGAVVAASASLIVLLGVWQIFISSPAVAYTTGFGETQNVVLPDGSSVVLNANSYLRYYQEQAGKREVDLRGEAFFSVVPTDDRQTFTVHSEGVTVEVVGTAFNVNNRRGKTQVVLESGKVVLNLPSDQLKSSATEMVRMKPSDLVEVSESDQQITRKIVNPARYSAWTQDVLIFDNVPLREVFELIRDTYGYRVKVVDEGIENKLWEAEISSQDIDLILEVLSKSFDLEIKKQGNELIVRRR